jgi:raffinose/stachyose/melibiose transport system permease protein
MPPGSSAPTRRLSARQAPWLLALPAILFLLLFHFVPVAIGGYFAFTSWNGLSNAHDWVGAQNFRDIFHDPAARDAFRHTLELAVLFVVLVNAIGLGLALALNGAVKSRNVLRAVFFAPVALSPLAVSFIWEWIFDFSGGLNRVLGWAGLDSLQRDWLHDPSTALWTILVVLVWQYSGLAMVLYLAGLQAISDDIYEATLVDGASTWLRLRRVVLPLLAPAVTVSATMTLIIGLRVFDQVLALTGGGPVTASETLATRVYKELYLNGRYGYGAAIALVLTTLITALALVQLSLLRANEQRL